MGNGNVRGPPPRGFLSGTASFVRGQGDLTDEVTIIHDQSCP
jgi:hypothetical protein